MFNLFFWRKKGTSQTAQAATREEAIPQTFQPREKVYTKPAPRRERVDYQNVKEKASQIILDAKQEALEIKRQTDEELKKEKQRLIQLEERIVQREERIGSKLDELEAKTKRLQDKVKLVQEKDAEVEKMKAEAAEKINEAAHMSKEEAENKVLEAAEERMKLEIVRRTRRLELVSQEEWERRANEILAGVIQRYAASQVSETTTSVVHLSNDEMKGRIIGKEGRNIKVLENVTGCEILVDETPGTIIVSGFSPLRRQIAKVAVERLVEDGRIQPARIEEVVTKAKKEVAKNVMEAGEEVVFDMGITDFHPNLVQLLGRLKYRTSYGQSILQHSWEAARIASMLATELGANVNIAKRATLLHDIGKAVDHEIEGDHVEIGINIMKKFNIPEEIIKAAASHHEDYPYETMEAVIVQVSDAISASRPGARRESLEMYVKRMEDLERIASTTEGVHKAYAIAAGREVRVFVKPEKIDDLTAIKMAQDIAQKIEQELDYPGEVKVNVIREFRSEAVAK